MPLAVLRSRKLKSAKDLTLAQQHNDRSRPTPNADPERTHLNQVLVGDRSVGLSAAVAARIEAAQPGKKVRSNAVLALDFVLSASPDYFAAGKGSGGTYAGRFDKRKTDAWARASVDFIRDKYGADNLVRAELHLDETTPHLHLQVVPIDSRGRLNARAVIGGSKNVLRDLQTEYARAVQHLGIERGLGGSRASHTDIDKFYDAVNQPTPELPDTRPPIKVREKSGVTEAMRLDDLDPLFESLEKAQTQANLVKLAKKEAADLKRANAQLSRQIDEVKAERDQLKADAARLRAIPAREVLAKLYGVKGTGDKFEVNGKTVVLDRNGKHRVGGPKGKLSGSALDLVRDLEGWPADASGAELARRKLLVEFPAEQVVADQLVLGEQNLRERTNRDLALVAKQQLEKALAGGRSKTRLMGQDFPTPDLAHHLNDEASVNLGLRFNAHDDGR